MIRTVATAILTSAALLASTGASAEGAYVATPVAAPAKSTLMTRDTAWNLRDGAFVTVNAPMREMAACQLVARSTGQLSGFSANGQSFDTDQLAACNAKAKGGKVAVAKADAAPAVAN